MSIAQSGVVFSLQLENLSEFSGGNGSGEGVLAQTVTW